MANVVTALREQEQWPCKIIAVHQDLGRMEWHETLPECRRQTQRLGLDLVIQQHTRHDLLAGIEERMAKRPDAPPFPSSAARYCTASWKRDPCSKWIRNNIEDGHACVVAMGLRADESRARARKPSHQVRRSAHSDQKQRTVFDWHPILPFTQADVWASLGYTMQQIGDIQMLVQAWRTNGLRGPRLMAAIQGLNLGFHPAYALGNRRLSCAMCVLACRSDLINGAEFRPDTFNRLVAIERESGFAFQQNKPLTDIIPHQQQL